MPQLTTIKAYEELSGDDALTPAEITLIAACRDGMICELGTTRPETLTPDTQIRATLLRLLITGASPACGLTDSGVWLQGAYITDTLDLDFATARGMTTLDYCTFAKTPHMMQARLHHLSFQDSQLPGVNASRMVVTGSVFLRRLNSTTTVDLSGAQITGQLDCTNATLNGQTGPQVWGDALNCQGASVGADMFFTSLAAKGTVDLNGAQIAGQLDLTGAKLDGQTGPDTWGRSLSAQGLIVGASLFLRTLTAIGMVDLNSAQITGQLDCEGAVIDGKGTLALNAQRLVVKQSFLWREVGSVEGQVYLASAAVSNLVDDPTSWPDDFFLDCFTYDRISGASTDATSRLKWLAKGARSNGTFYPQPYTQLAKVLTQLGHDREARIVLMERERCLAEKLQKSQRAAFLAAYHGPDTRADSGKIWLQMQGARLWSAMSRTFAGYGYAPQRALYWSLGLTLFSTVLYFIAYRQGWMVPTSAILLASPDWITAFQTDPVRPALHWTGAAATHYETFYALPYAFDVYLPIVDLGYSSTWGQTTTTSPGTLLRGWTLLLQAAGYVITGLGLAAITGLIQRDRS